MNETLDTLEKYMYYFGISSETAIIAERPDGLFPQDDAEHFEITLHCEDRSADFYYSRGSGYKGKPWPNYRDLLKALIADIRTVAPQPIDIYGHLKLPFEAWATELGYNTDSRATERVYLAILEGGEKLYTLLDSDHAKFNPIVYQTNID